LRLLEQATHIPDARPWPEPHFPRTAEGKGKIEFVKSLSPVASAEVKRIVAHVNRKKWWHVPPSDPTAYNKRGKFFASSFEEAEFYGRPLDVAERVAIARPLVGDEQTIAKVLGMQPQHEGMSLEEIAAHDALWRNAALTKGFDSIVLMSPKAFAKFRADGKPPRSLELNILSSELQ
jgi:hypothetical protein